MSKVQNTPINSELGKKSEYRSSYDPDRLFPIPRADKRREIGIDPNSLPFHGFDGWNHYEVSWLNEKGKPMVAMAEIFYDCHSPMIIESKSMKLYFNSFNNHKFSSLSELEHVIKHDLEKRIHSRVIVAMYPLNDSKLPPLLANFEGECLDSLDIECTQYTVTPQYLKTHDKNVEEVLYSDLLKSNCLVTGQPDWGSVQIAYKGKQIDHEGLLQYIVSFRNHNEFHEQCIERIFNDIMNHCHPAELTVYGRYTRRGGVDINPCRSTQKIDYKNKNFRLIRQ